jgi:hypothetical protein
MSFGGCGNQRYRIRIGIKNKRSKTKKEIK